MSWLPFDPALAAGIQGRRHELFRLAAPVFRAHGYRGATIKALAHACHLSPAALYHYFPSKAASATFLIDEDHLDWDSTRIDPDIDPLVQLRMTVDVVIDVLPTYLLAVDLAREMGRPLSQPQLAGFFGQGEAIFGRVIAAAAPNLEPDGARELARRVLAIIVAGSTTGRCAADPPRSSRRRCRSLRQRDGDLIATGDHGLSLSWRRSHDLARSTRCCHSVAAIRLRCPVGAVATRDRTHAAAVLAMGRRGS